MSYTMLRTAGLGWTGNISMKTPWGTERASITVPVEQAAEAAVNAAWPLAERKMRDMLPSLMDMALSRAGGYVTTDLWPKMRPLFQKEVDVAIRKGEVVATEAVDTATQRAAMLGGAVIMTIAGAAWWISRKQRRG